MFCHKAHEISPSRIRPLWLLGQLNLMRDQSQRAAEYLNEAIEIYSLNALSYFNRGMIFYETGDYSQAMADFLKALEIEPEYRKAHLFLGIAGFRNGNTNQAMIHLNKAAKLGDKDAEMILLKLSEY